MNVLTARAQLSPKTSPHHARVVTFPGQVALEAAAGAGTLEELILRLRRKSGRALHPDCARSVQPPHESTPLAVVLGSPPFVLWLLLRAPGRRARKIFQSYFGAQGLGQ